MSLCRPAVARILVGLFLTAMLGVPAGLCGDVPDRPSAQSDRQGGPASPSAGIDPAALRNLDKLIEDGRFEEAEKGARGLLDKARSTHTLETQDGIRALLVLVRALVRGGKAAAPETRQLAEQTVTLSERVIGPDDPLTADSLGNLGDVCLANEDFDEARELFERGLRIREKALGPENLPVAKSLHDLGKVCLIRRDMPQAKSYLERARRIREKLLGPDDYVVASTLNNLAIIANDAGDYEESRKLFERCVAINEKKFGPEHPGITVPLDNLANVLEALGDYSESLKIHERSLAILEKTYPPDHPEIGMTLYGLAAIHFQLGDYPRGWELEERALAIFEKSEGPESLNVALVLQALGRTCEEVDDYAGALRYHERSLQITEKTLGPESTSVAARVLLLGEVYEDLGDDAAAEAHYRRALEIYEKHVKDHPSAVDAILGIGRIRLRAGDTAQAMSLFQRSLRIEENAFGPESPYVGECQKLIAKVHWAEGGFPEALDLALQAQANFRRQFERTASNLAEREALGYLKVLNSAKSLALSLVTAAPSASVPPEARGRIWEEVIRTRGIVLDEAGRRHRAVHAAEGPEVETLWKSLVSKRNILAALTVQGPNPEELESFREKLGRAVEARDRAERALTEKSSVYRRRMSEQDATLSDIESKLPDGSALVAYVRYDRLPPPGKVAIAGSAPPPPEGYYLAAVLAPGRKPRFFPLGPAREIEARVSQWRNEIAAGASTVGGLGRASEARYREMGSRLREAIWDPIAPGIRGQNQVFVVPDGALNLVSFATLPVGETSYLVERKPLLHLLSAERDLLRDWSGSRTVGSSLILGGPDFDALPHDAGRSSLDPRTPIQGRSSPSEGSVNAAAFRSAPPACGAFREIRFDALMASAQEAAEIGTLLGADRPETAGRGRPVVVTTGITATESAFKRLAPGAGILHLATHAFFAQGECESIGDPAGPETSGISSSSSGPFPAARDNPLLLSGLALAGANRRGEAGPDDEDGILTAEEIASLDLSGVEWAVLSACETGVGKIQPGEGVLGLRRAFQIAGAGSVIMSLWKVEDESTRKWMRALYEGRLKRLSTDKAVRNASLTILRDRRGKGQNAHPFYWGAFVAAGDWR